MFRLRVLTGTVLALSLLGAACDSRLLRPPATVFADGGEAAVSATVAGERWRFPSVLLSFLPSQVPLHPGDEVNFDVRDTGEPHTVALGSLVDEALEAVEGLGPAAEAPEIEALAQMRRIPTLFPRTVVGDRPRVNRSAAERCFLAEGVPPVSDTGDAPPCDPRGTPVFDGTHTFYSSGLLKEGEPFRMRLSGDIPPGTYRFMCLVHRSQMTGAIEVRSPDVERPAVAQLREQSTREQDELLSSLEPPARRAVGRDADVVLAGTGPEGRHRGFVAAFIPEEFRTNVGDVVTWNLFGTHSISFNPPRQAREGVLVEERGGGVRINTEAWSAVHSPAPPSSAVTFPPTEPEVAVDGGTWPGEGFFSSGVLRATPPAVVSYALRFSEPGTYSYFCLVHPSMRGRVEVV